jgi:hypothetical protein
MDQEVDRNYWGEIPFPYSELDRQPVECDLLADSKRFFGDAYFEVRVRNDVGLYSIAVTRDRSTEVPGRFVIDHGYIPVRAFCLIRKHPDKEGYLLRGEV